MRSLRTAAGAALALSVLVPTSIAAAPLYMFMSLGSLKSGTAEPSTTAYDVNDAGQVVGSSFNDGGRMEAFRTAPNAAINPATDGLGDLAGPGRYSEGLAINDRGQVVGSVAAPDGGGGARAFFTAPNQRIDSHMGTLNGGTFSVASGNGTDSALAAQRDHQGAGGINDVLNSVENQ